MTPPTPDDTARTWRDLADQLTPEQIAILEDHRWGCAHASATPTASPLAISSSIRPSESPPSSLSLALAVAVATQEISLRATLKLWSKPSCTRESATSLTPERR